MIALAVLATGCSKKKEKSTALNYTDKNPIKMVFRDTHRIAVESDYDISYEILGTSSIPILEWQSTGVLKAKNVGSDKVRIRNGYETKTVDVIVDLFTEPSFEFGCSPERIQALHGTPSLSGYVDESDTLCYRYIGTESTNYMYSPTCYYMDFYFNSSRNYYYSQLFLKNNYDIPLNNYFEDNFDSLFVLSNIYYDEYITQDSISAIIYKSKINENVRCGKYEHANQYDDICLFYYQVTNATQNDSDKLLKNLPRSSKFLYWS